MQRISAPRFFVRWLRAAFIDSWHAADGVAGIAGLALLLASQIISWVDIEAAKRLDEQNIDDLVLIIGGSTLIVVMLYRFLFAPLWIYREIKDKYGDWNTRVVADECHGLGIHLQAQMSQKNKAQQDKRSDAEIFTEFRPKVTSWAKETRDRLDSESKEWSVRFGGFSEVEAMREPDMTELHVFMNKKLQRLEVMIGNYSPPMRLG